jgi:predicted transcriptional regulator of viral defense system
VKLTDAHARLRELGAPTFTTNDAAALLRIEGSHATKVLCRLAETGHVVRLARGRWALGDELDRFALPEALTAPTPSYVSLFSALHHHGLIEQIPAAVYAVTLAPSRDVRTPLGTVSLHRVAPSFFFGFEQRGTGPKIAVPEKGLVDFLYLGPARSRRFRALPELELPRSFSGRRAREMARRIESRSRRSYVLSKLDRILENAGSR